MVATCSRGCRIGAYLKPPCVHCFSGQLEVTDNQCFVSSRRKAKVTLFQKRLLSNDCFTNLRGDEMGKGCFMLISTGIRGYRSQFYNAQSCVVLPFFFVFTLKLPRTKNANHHYQLIYISRTCTHFRMSFFRVSVIEHGFAINIAVII